MNIFQRIRSGFQQAAQRVRGAVRRIFAPEPVTTGPIELPTPGKIKLHNRMQQAEREATERAVWAIQNALENPDDWTAQHAKDKAIEYLSRSKELSGKGSLQDYNRLTKAQSWIESELSSEEGQTERFDRQLENFNNNFNINLTRDSYKTMKKLMDSPSFKKLMEQNKAHYELIFGTVGDQVEAGVDPVRIEQTLDIFSRYGMDSFENFKDITALNADDYTNLMEDMQLLDETQFFDEIDRKEAFEGVLGRYITW